MSVPGLAAQIPCYTLDFCKSHAIRMTFEVTRHMFAPGLAAQIPCYTHDFYKSHAIRMTFEGTGHRFGSSFAMAILGGPVLYVLFYTYFR